MNEIHEVYPYLRVHSTADAISFYARVFGAVEIFRLTEPTGRIGHAEIKIGPATVMLSDEYPEHGLLEPRSSDRPSFLLHIHTANVDEMFERAVEAGASVIQPLQDQFYGERTATIRDPFGHEWLLGAQIESLTSAEMQRRYTALFEE